MMLSWFAPQCPVNVRDRVLVERTLGKLAVALRIDFNRPRDVITLADFASLVDADRLTPRAVSSRVIQNLDVSRDELPEYLDLPPGARKWGDSESSDARHETDGEAAVVDFATRAVIGAYLDRRAASIGAVAGEPYVVELCAVLIGAGVYPANQTVHESYSSGGLRFSWRMSTSGGMPSILFGYAFAVDAWLRSGDLPAWSRFLRRDARESFANGLRFLAKRGSGLLRRDSPAPFDCAPGAHQVVDALHSRDAACRVNGLLDVVEFAYTDSEILDGIGACLRDRDPDVVPTACEAAARLGEAAAPLLEDVFPHSAHESAAVRGLVADAIGGMQGSGREAIGVLEQLVGDPVQSVSLAGIRALFRLPAGTEAAFELAIARLERCILTSELSGAEFLLRVLSEQVDDLGGFVKSRLWERLDAEGRGVLEHELARHAEGEAPLDS